MMKKIVKELSTIDCNLSSSDLADYYDIEIRHSDNINIFECPGYIVLSDLKAVIYIGNNLPYEFETFVILHEIGHYVLDYATGTYKFMYKFRSIRGFEFRANLFACLYLLKRIDLVNIDVPAYLIRCGCPANIAWKIYQYISSLQKENLKYFFNDNICLNDWSDCTYA